MAKITLIGPPDSGVTDLAAALGDRHPRVQLTDRPDGAVVVVKAGDGYTRETAELVELAGQIGVPIVAIYMNEAGEHPEIVELNELETRELLNKHGHGGDAMPVVKGKDAVARLGKLLDGKR